MNDESTGSHDLLLRRLEENSEWRERDMLSRKWNCGRCGDTPRQTREEYVRHMLSAHDINLDWGAS